MSGLGSTYGVGRGFLGVMIYNRMAGCVCNIIMPSVDTVCHSENWQFFSKVTPPGL